MFSVREDFNCISLSELLLLIVSMTASLWVHSAGVRGRQFGFRVGFITQNEHFLFFLLSLYVSLFLYFGVHDIDYLRLPLIVNKSLGSVILADCVVF